MERQSINQGYIITLIALCRLKMERQRSADRKNAID